MPQIPVSEPRVQDQKLQGVRFSGASAESFGAGEGRQLAAFGQGVQNMAQDVRAFDKRTEELKSKAVSRDAFSSAQDEAREFLYGKNGVYSRKGKDAIDVYDETKTKMDEIRRKYTGALKDPEQQTLFVSSFDKLRDDHLDSVVKWQDKARVDYEHMTLDSENNSAMKDAVAMRSDPKKIADAEATITQNTLYKLRGMDDKLKKAGVAEAIHTLHNTVMESIAQDSPNAALGYLQANWDKFNPIARENAKKDLQEKGKLEFAVTEAKRLDGLGLTMDQQLAEADKVKKPELAEKLRDIIKERFKDKEAADHAARKSTADAEIDKIRKDPYAYQVPLSLPADTQERLLELQKKFKERHDNPTDPATYQQLNAMKVEDFKKVNLLDYSSRLSIGDFKHFSDLQKKDDDAYKSAQSLSAYVGEMVKGAKLDEKSAGDIPKVAFMRELFENELNKYPVDQRNRIETWNKIKDTLMLDMNVRENRFFNQKYWEMKMEGKTGEPDERPDTLPKGATWIDKKVGEQVMRGWTYTNPAGASFFYSVDGSIRPIVKKGK